MKVFIGFSKPKKFMLFAWLIQKVESREYDHVYIRVQEPSNNTWMIFQASSVMVNLCSANNFMSVNTAVKEYEIDINDGQFSSLWDFINASLGTPYSLIEDFGILLIKIFKLKHQPFNKGMSAQFCSKLGANVCIMLDIDIPVDVSTVDPSQLDRILELANLPYILNPEL